MQPEISHRCPSCGASIRDFAERALFCPECGKPVANEQQDKRNVGDAASVAMPDSPETAESVANESSGQGQAARIAEIDDDSTRRRDRGKTTKTARAAGIVRHGGERTRETLHRASSAARGAIGDNVKRVEKIHHVSTVMFEEATYDPSLRFVLVALALFLLFIILLVLSKVMG
jgi:predicted RNA-binding Zn-ribbon protein involved in translation (DUF1610 family)